MTKPSDQLASFAKLLPSFLDLGCALPFVAFDEHGRHKVTQEFGEFRGHIPYSPGEDLRFLDWKVLARSGQRVLRRFDGTEHRRLIVCLDASASMSLQMNGARRIALLYCYLGMHSLDSVELVLLCDEGPVRVPLQGPESFGLALERLENLECGGNRGLSDLGPLLDRSLRGGGIVVLSDFQPSEACGEFLQRCAGPGRSLLCLFPRTNLEGGREDLVLRGRAQIVDPETGRQLDLEVSPKLLAAFREEQHAWEREMARCCHELGHRFLAQALPGDDDSLHLESWLPFVVHRTGQGVSR